MHTWEGLISLQLDNDWTIKVGSVRLEPGHTFSGASNEHLVFRDGRFSRMTA